MSEMSMGEACDGFFASPDDIPDYLTPKQIKQLKGACRTLAALAVAKLEVSPERLDEDSETATLYGRLLFEDIDRDKLPSLDEIKRAARRGSHSWDTDEQAMGVIAAKSMLEQHTEQELERRLKIAAEEIEADEESQLDAAELMADFDEHVHPLFLSK